MNERDVKKIVREGYASIAKENKSCCAPKKTCCGSKNDTASHISSNIGYSEKEMTSVPEGSNLGLGCGNPIALASLKEGEVVMDLGSGAGFDSFLAANKVGDRGHVIGVDMTHEMLDKARGNAEKGGYKNVEFRLGEIENIPAGDNSVDVIISNCVINLSPNKSRVFSEANRVLKPGGRLMVSDITLHKELPDEIKKCVAAYVGCLSGAVFTEEYVNLIKEAGFNDVEIVEETYFEINNMLNDPTAKAIIKTAKLSEKDIQDLDHSVLSVRVKATK